MAQLTLRPGHNLAWLTLSLLTAGCTNNAPSSSDVLTRIPSHSRVSDIYQGRSPEVVRYDKYTLVSTRPADAQRDPLNQMIDITMPAQLVRSVGEGLRYLLLESGYSLCAPSSPVFSALLSRPLPAVQRSIGPVRLSEALQVLAGPAWRLRVDDVNREICFTLRDAYRDFAPKTVTAVNAGIAPVPVVATRASGNPFAVSSSAPSPVRSLAPVIPGTVPTKPALKPESVPVPSPALKVMNNDASVSNATKPMSTVASVHQPDLNVQPQVKPASPVAPVVSPVKAPTSVKNDKPSPNFTGSSVVVPSVPAAKPVFTPGMPVSAVPSGQLWRAEVGSTLKETLTRWAGTAKCDNGGNWVVIWPVSLDYRIDAPLTFNGNFESVLVQVFGLYRQADKPLYAEASRMQCLVSVSDQPGRK